MSRRAGTAGLVKQDWWAAGRYPTEPTSPPRSVWFVWRREWWWGRCAQTGGKFASPDHEHSMFTLTHCNHDQSERCEAGMIDWLVKKNETDVQPSMRLLWIWVRLCGLDRPATSIYKELIGKQSQQGHMGQHWGTLNLCSASDHAFRKNSTDL